MTTAARPTWTPAKGQENTGYYKEFVPSKQYSSKDLPGHLELKVRQEGQSSEEELRLRDLKAELLEKENKHFDSRRKEDSRLLLTAGSKRAAPEIKPEELPKANREDRDEEFENDSDEDDSDEENEANELMKELQKIRQEREMEKEKQRMKEEAEKEAQTQNEVMSSNPLLNLVCNSCQHYSISSLTKAEREGRTKDSRWRRSGMMMSSSETKPREHQRKRQSDLSTTPLGVTSTESFWTVTLNK
uniref:Uncharacterized protein n=1 Tax=Palpitomonas bilix TaxID=652834 RepID=A0A7S3DFU9_9EUKA|mmetsp:Transcript_35692/g.93030  ORF Transcript_35692/g.93030 Transcript_35692/m.93030 type:complete len:245 (+) Transcript_35692:62-796(+)